MRKYRTAWSLMVVLALSWATARAEDLVPPNWRGNPGTTWVQYEFNKPHEYLGPSPYYPTHDDGYLPLGLPVLTYIPGPGAGWHPLQPTWLLGGGAGPYNPPGDPGDGWLNLSGEISLWLPNFDNNHPHKEMWIQLVWEPQAPGNMPTLQLLDPLGPPTTVPLVRTVLWQAPPTDPNPWRAVYHDVWHFDIYPNPRWEKFQIRGGINVDELVVDTWCVGVPLPAGVWQGLAGLMVVLGAAAWRRFATR